MARSSERLVSVVVPVYNESLGLQKFHDSLTETIKKLPQYKFEILYCDDGSSDDSRKLILAWHHSNPSVKLVSLSRNFGKEAALSAGIALSSGQAIITIDSDGQHPVELIGQFIEAWQKGSRAVIGVRKTDQHLSQLKRLRTKAFYSLFNKLSNQELVPGSDYRLIDRSIQQEFIKLKEKDRVYRGLIDWLGFDKTYIYFSAKQRLHGSPAYSRKKLILLAKNSVVSMSPRPLYMFGYLGIIITTLTFILGVAVIIEQLILGDPWHWRFTGTAMLGILIAFLVGLVLMSEAVLSLYISSIQNETRGRPLYVIDYQNSVGIDDKSGS